jgi:hypothetical protein
MKAAFAGFASAIMIVYTLYRFITTVVFLPLAGPRWGSAGVYFLMLVLLAVATTTLSFTRHKGLAAIVASALGPIGLAYWWFVICHGATPIWSDFFWFVVPEVCFSLAGICKWLASRPPGFRIESQASAT